MDDFAFPITPENIDYIKLHTRLDVSVLEANLNWIVYRNANTYFKWQIVPPREFQAMYPDITPHIP